MAFRQMRQDLPPKQFEDDQKSGGGGRAFDVSSTQALQMLKGTPVQLQTTTARCA